MSVAVLGMGSWGTALAGLLGAAGHPIRAWSHRAEQREALRRDRENTCYLPGIPLPDMLTIWDSPREAIEGAETVLMAVPSFAVRTVAAGIAPRLSGRLVINTAKGLEEETGARMLEVLADELGADAPAASLVGPSHAEEVARNHPTAVVATSTQLEWSLAVQGLLSGPTFRVYTNEDCVGVELAVALKNVIALAAGIAAGLGFGANTLGALVTRGLAEMTRLGVALGARPETFFGLAGVGDMVTTCASEHSRNRRVGEALGRGESLDEVLAGMNMVAEGVRTTRAARDLARRHDIDTPIVDHVYAVLFEGAEPLAALHALMTREPKAESPEGTRPGGGAP